MKRIFFFLGILTPLVKLGLGFFEFGEMFIWIECVAAWATHNALLMAVFGIGEHHMLHSDTRGHCSHIRNSLSELFRAAVPRIVLHCLWTSHSAGGEFRFSNRMFLVYVKLPFWSVFRISSWFPHATVSVLAGVRVVFVLVSGLSG